MPRLLPLLALLCGILLLQPLAVDPAHAAYPVVGRLRVSDSTPVAGTVVTFLGRTTPQVRRNVRVQIQAGTTWKGLAKGVADSRGHFAVQVRVPHTELASYTYRVRLAAFTRNGHSYPTIVTPTVTLTTQRTDWQLVSSMYGTTCGLRTDHSLRCWGRNAGYNLGNGTTTDALRPVIVPGDWAKVFVGNDHTCAIDLNGAASCFGSYSPAPGQTVTQPRPTPLPGTGWASFVLTDDRSQCGLKTDSTAWCWGDNSTYQFATGTTTPVPFAAPVQLPGLWRSLTVDDGSVCGVRPDDTGWCWGASSRGTSGVGLAAAYRTPQHVPGSWSTLRTVLGTTCGLTVTGGAQCWGENADGSVGDGTTTNRSHPFAFAGRWKSITPSRGKFTCGQLASNYVECWGQNTYGQLGDGTTTDRTKPWIVTDRNGQAIADWQSIDVGPGGVCGLRAGGVATCFGYNASGQLGGGTSATGTRPATVAGSGFTGITSTYPIGLAFGAQHQLLGWGENGQGQLATGTTTDAWRPVLIQP